MRSMPTPPIANKGLHAHFEPKRYTSPTLSMSTLPPLPTASFTRKRSASRRMASVSLNWKATPAPMCSPAERFDYSYPLPELKEWLPKIRKLEEEAEEVHLLMNNCYGDKAVRNAEDLATLLAKKS